MTDPTLLPPLDLLAVGAHPDDADLFAGGTIALAAGAGKRVGIMDLTRGEAATRGTPDTRCEESEAASKILGLTQRVRLDLGDGRIANNETQRRAVVDQLRRLRPRVVVTHQAQERHPDHGATHALVRDACFFANVRGYDAEGPRHKVEALVYFYGFEGVVEPAPDWIVDVGVTYKAKRQALAAYATQFNVSAKEFTAESATYVASQEFWRDIESRSRRWGHLIGVSHGEAFTFQHPAHSGHPFVAMTADAAKPAED